MEIDLQAVIKRIRLLENLKECYKVKLYYLGSKSSGASECEMNDLELQKLLCVKEIETIIFEVSHLYIEYDNLHCQVINQNINSSMQNDKSTVG